MTRRTLLTLTITAIVTLGSLASPDPGEARVSVSRRVTDSGIDERISLELRDADVTQVLTSFGQIFEVEVDIDPEVRGEISIEVHNVRAATALTAVCESVGCLWRIEGGVLKVTRDPNAPEAAGTPHGRAEGPSAAQLDELIDMELKDADLRQVLAAFASIAGVEVVIDEALTGDVTVQLHDTPVRVALDALCNVQGCRWELVETEEGPVLQFRKR